MFEASEGERQVLNDILPSYPLLTIVSFSFYLGPPIFFSLKVLILCETFLLLCLYSFSIYTNFLCLTAETVHLLLYIVCVVADALCSYGSPFFP